MSNIDITHPSFCKRLRALRLQRNMSVRELGRLSGVSCRRIYDFENGRAKRAQEATLLAISSALGTTFEVFLGGKPPDATTERSPTPPLTNGRAGDYYAEGIEHLESHRPDEARESFHRAIACDSSYFEAYVMLLHPEIRGNTDECLAVIETARQHTKSAANQLVLDIVEAWARSGASGSTGGYERVVQAKPHVR